LFQVRVDPELYARFQSLCDSKNVTVSEAIRRIMLSQVEHDDARRSRKEYVQMQLERRSST